MLFAYGTFVLCYVLTSDVYSHYDSLGDFCSVYEY